MFIKLTSINPNDSPILFSVKDITMVELCYGDPYELDRLETSTTCVRMKDNKYRYVQETVAEVYEKLDQSSFKDLARHEKKGKQK